MTLKQTLQSNTNRTKELFDKLEETSDQATKTRENLFEELSRELRLHVELEQKHLLPALRANDKTKALATDAAKVNQEVRGKIDEIEALAKNDPSFRPRVAELRKLFQRQLRDERNELLPAIEKELSDEQAEALVKRMEAKRARHDEEQRAADEERRQEGRREADHDKAVAARQKAVAEVVDATKQNARDARNNAAAAVEATRETAAGLGRSAAEAVRDGAERVRDTSEKAVNTVATAARRAKEGAEQTATAYRETARERGADVRAFGTAFRTFAQVSGELRGVFLNSVRQSSADGFEMTRKLLRRPWRAGEAQREYAAASTRNLMESAKEVLQILRAASGAARQPLDERLKATA